MASGINRSGCGFDEFNCFFSSNPVALGIVEDGQQVKRGTEDKGSVSLWVITQIQVIAHRCFNAGQFMVQYRVTDDPGCEDDRKGEDG